MLQRCYPTVFFKGILSCFTVHHFRTLKQVSVVLFPSHTSVYLLCFITVCAKLRISIGIFSVGVTLVSGSVKVCRLVQFEIKTYPLTEWRCHKPAFFHVNRLVVKDFC
jgi:hypothetical protein